MIILLSPAKTLDENYGTGSGKQLPTFRKQSSELISILKEYPPAKIKSLMHISDKLTELNHKRYHSFSSRYTDKNSKAAIYAFRGDVYLGLDADTLTSKDLDFAEKHLRILSGLYGLLKPYDKMQPYRLEMGTALKNNKGKNLYEFWKDTLTKEINKSLKKNQNDLIVNLASKEYFSAIDKSTLKGEIQDISFKEYKGDTLKFISFNAKKARGLMTRYIIQNRITNRDDLKGFNLEGYTYSEENSTDQNYMFVR